MKGLFQSQIDQIRRQPECSQNVAIVGWQWSEPDGEERRGQNRLRGAFGLLMRSAGMIRKEAERARQDSNL